MAQDIIRIIYAVGGAILIIGIARLVAGWAESRGYSYLHTLAKWVQKAGFAFAILFAVYTSIPLIPMPPDIFKMVKATVEAVSIMVAGYLLSALVEDMMRIYFTSRQVDAFLTRLPYIIVRITILVVAALIALEKAGIPISPILTTVGVGGIAVALAVQDILGNAFSGIMLILGKQIRPGDFIRINEEITGIVEDIHIRNTVIRRPFDGAKVIIPNKLVADSAVVNFQKDADGVYGIAITIGVSYDSDLEKAVQIAKAVADEVVREIEDAYREFEPIVRVDSFGDSAINLKVLMKSDTLGGRFKMIDAFYRKIKKAFAEAGIEIPYPKQDVYIKEMPKA